jgi:hypothetical protein
MELDDPSFWLAPFTHNEIQLFSTLRAPNPTLPPRGIQLGPRLAVAGSDIVASVYIALCSQRIEHHGENSTCLPRFPGEGARHVMNGAVLLRSSGGRDADLCGVGQY